MVNNNDSNLQFRAYHELLAALLHLLIIGTDILGSICL